jgi:hypothetical protein
VPITLSSIFLLSLGAVIAAAAGMLARAHQKRVERATSGQTSSLAVALKRMPPAARISALAARAPEGSVEGLLADELGRAEDDAARCAAVNDLLADIELTLEASSSWPRAATRIAAYGTLLLAAIAVLGDAGVFVTAALVILGVGGAGFCISVDTRTKALARDRRKAIDALVEALVPRALLAPAQNKRETGPSRHRPS